jgi:hypothetical protein
LSSHLCLDSTELSFCFSFYDFYTCCSLPRLMISHPPHSPRFQNRITSNNIKFVCWIPNKFLWMWLVTQACLSPWLHLMMNTNYEPSHYAVSFFLLSLHLLSSKYFPQHPVRTLLQSAFFALCEGLISKPIQSNRQCPVAYSSQPLPASYCFMCKD